MSFLRSVKLFSITLWLLPGIVETGVFAVVALNLLLWPLPDWLPDRVIAVRWLGVTGSTIMLWVIAVRQRLDPVGGGLFLAAALPATMVTMSCVSNPDFRSNLICADSGWEGATLYDLLLRLVLGVGGASLMLAWWRRLLRKRGRAIPGLVKLVTRSGRNARRKAIFVLAHLEAVDRAAGREDGYAWVRWLYKSDTPPAMTDAVPALMGALRDDDLFVRTQAAKVLRNMGVQFAEMDDTRESTRCQEPV